jgi:hypothetical protein
VALGLSALLLAQFSAAPSAQATTGSISVTGSSVEVESISSPGT